jgi:hypothetical protein
MGFLVSALTVDVGASILCKRVGPNAQSELQFWNKQNTTSDGVITQSMTIDEDGNVGIGQSSPSEKLTVAGNVRIEGDNRELYFTGNKAQIRASSSSTPITFVNSSTELMRITQGGNVGIGTTSPSQKLVVAGDIKLDGVAPIIYVNSSNNTSGLRINVTGLDDDTDTLFRVQDNGTNRLRVERDGDTLITGDLTVQGDISTTGTFTIIDTDVSTTEQLVVTNDGTGPAAIINQKGVQPIVDFQDDSTSVFYIKNGGNVGLGTTTPATSLQVSKLDDTSAITIHRDGSNPSTNTSLGKIIFAQDYNGTQQNSWGQIELKTNASSVRTDMAFKVKSTGGNEMTAMTLHGTASDGPRVGIGTATPAEKLHVSGSENDVIIKCESTGAGAWFSTSSTNQQYQGYKVGHNWFMGQHASNDFVVKDGLQSSGAIALQIVDTTRYLGINTAPTSPLHLSAAAISQQGTPVTAITKTIATTSIGAKLSFTNAHNANGNLIGGISMGNTGEEYAGLYALDGGSSAATHLAFFTGNNTATTEAIRILSDGNVGIGETSPSKKLHIDGDIKVKNSGKLFLWNDNDNNYLDYQNWIASTGNAQLIRNTGSGGIKLKSTSLEVVVTSGLGIGVTSPESKVHIQNTVAAGSDNFALHLHNPTHASDSRVGVMFRVNNNTGSDIDGAAIQAINNGVNGEAHLTFGTVLNGTFDEHVRIASNGNVGIGKDPSVPLDVNGNIKASQVGVTNIVTNKIVKFAGTYFDDSSLTDTGSVVTVAAGLEVDQHLNVDSGTLYVDSSGNKVGIGTTTPSSLLNLSDASNNLSHQIGFSYVSGGTETDAFTIGRSSSTGNLEFHSDINNHGFEFKHNAAGTQEFNILNMKVGIGTDAPSQKLDISAGNIELDTAYAIQWGGTANRIWGSGGNNYIKIETNGVERLRVDGQGDVGINETNPAEKLHVKGNARVGYSSTNGHLIGSKAYTITHNFTTGLTVSLAHHTACHVKVFITGDWGNHSSLAYVGEFLIQNAGDTGYNEPGIILTQQDNLHSDSIAAKIVDPTTGGGSPNDFTIQFQAVSDTSESISGRLCYHIMGDALSVS